MTPIAHRRGYVYLNGDVHPVEDARVSVLDRGFLWGDGVYEITPCFYGTPFRLDEHLDRLFSSVRSVSIALDMSKEQLTTQTIELVEMNRDVTSSATVCRIGHWVTRGIEQWVSIEERHAVATLCILVQPAGSLPPPEVYRSGVRLKTVTTRRSPPSSLDPRLKTTSRMNPILAELEARDHLLALMLDVDDHIAEGPTFNFFLVRDGELFTPRAERVLPGITRRAVLELADELGVPTREADLSLDDLASAREAFVTASTWGVLPVRSVDQLDLAEVGGETTTTLLESLARITGFHPIRDERPEDSSGS